ncbi:MAG: sulfite exporter TauE/SafE family protein [Clostridia bacterium]|nr:sulfite exporter TauE/SafE family protein [Clostridia bacterium]
MKRKKKNWLLAACGLIVGAVNGLFGAGGGMLVVPVFSIVEKLEQKKSHATAVITMLPICLFSSIGYLASGVVEFKPLIFVMMGSIVGGLVGAFALCKIKNDFLVIIFYILMIFAGVFSILKQYNVI